MLFLRPLAGNRARSLRPGPAAAPGGTDRPLVLRPAHKKIGAGAALFLGVRVTLSPSTTSRPGGDPLLPLLFRPLKPRPRGSFFSVPAVLPHSSPRRLFPKGNPLEKGFFPHFSNRKKPRGGPGLQQAPGCPGVSAWVVVLSTVPGASVHCSVASQPPGLLGALLMAHPALQKARPTTRTPNHVREGNPITGAIAARRQGQP